ncbi:MAG: MFS transporter [Syntrophomonadaceae bacterium]|nr:MFS transporter [Syntrophomonadaceae bacterium]
MKWRAFLLLGGAHFITDFYLNFVPALLPVMVRRLDISLALAGLVVAGSQITANFLQPIFGYIFDSRPSLRWLTLSLAVSGCFMCASGSVSSYFLFLLFPMIAGVGNGMFHPVGSTLTYHLDPDNRGTLMSLFASIGALGFALGPAVAAFFLARWDARTLFILLIPAVLIIFGLKRIELPSVSRKSVVTEGKRWPTISRVMGLLIAVMALRAWGHMAFGNYLVFYLEASGYTYQTAANILTWFLILGALGGVAGGKISDIRGRKPVIGWTILVGAICAGLFLLTSGIKAIVFLMACGLLVHASQPVMVVLAQELMPGSIGLATGISMGFVWGLGSLGLLLSGVVADMWGLPASFWLAVLVLLLGAGLSLLLPVEKERRESQHERI